jgi:P-type Cu+ transporter
LADRYRQAMFNESLANNDATTRNHRRIVTVIALDGRSETSLLTLAAAIAAGLEPALAAAIEETARERGASRCCCQDVVESTATGVAGSVADHSVVVGNAAFLTKLGISLEHLCDWPDRMRQHGQQVVLVAIDGRAASFFGVSDGAA